MRAFSLVAVLLPALAHAVDQREAAAVNPIRKVVTMLQAMQTKVTEEGEKEKDLYEKFQCYCKTSGGDLSSSIAAAEAKMPSVGSDIKRLEEQKVQTEEDLKSAQTDRSAAKAAIAEATAIREKEAAAFAAESAEYSADISAINQAVAALEKGMSGAFLQTSAAQVLQGLVSGKHSELLDDDRQVLASFLSGGQGAEYAPRSGQITGILKELGDEMAAHLKEVTATEDAAIKAYEDMMAAKKKEVGALTKTVEVKMGKVGTLGVEIAQAKNDLTDTEEALLADKEFFANLQKSCDTKTAEWDERVKTRADELVALSETIKLLNDDDALDLFKNTLPSASASFVQVRASTVAWRAKAMAELKKARGIAQSDRTHLDVILLALRGKKIGFEKVIKMIDGMVATLKTEQLDDDHKKEYCAAQFDTADDKKKELERSVSDAETAIQSAEEGISTVKDEIAALEAGIKELDKSVAESTEQRKQEHKEFQDLMSSNTAAKELLGFAKNRLNKFYNPKMYKPPAEQEATATLAQVALHLQRKAAPPPPPETFGAYTKKSQESTGVTAMIDLLIKDLDKELTEAETEERDGQADYEAMMADSAAKRTADSKSLTEKKATKADLMSALESQKEAKTSTGKELASMLKYIQSLHSECDWLMQYFDVRKEARASEIDALGKAKAVLGGADFSLLQVRGQGFLRRSA